MSMFSRFGAKPRFLAAAAVSFALFSGAAIAQNGYVDVRVANDNVGCGPVVIKWPADQEERVYDPNPGANDPKLDMAETRPLPVIHHHPALNAGGLYLPPQDGLYRHYFPESEAPPRLRRWIRPVYEEYLRDQNPPTDVPFAVGDLPENAAGVPGTVIVPTGMTTPPAAFVGNSGTYVPAPVTLNADPGIIQEVPAQIPAKVVESSFILPEIVPQAGVDVGNAPAQTITQIVTEQTPAAPAPAKAAADEGTGSFIHLSGLAEKVPFAGTPEAAAELASLLPESASSSPAVSVMVPAANASMQTFDAGSVGAVLPAAMVPAFGEPGDGSAPAGKCGTPVCQ